MMLAAVRFRFLALVTSLALAIVGPGPAWGQNMIAQYDFGLLSGETSMGKDLSGRSNPPGGPNQGWEAYYVDPNATANDAYLSDSIPPSNEDYIEDPPTGPLYGFLITAAAGFALYPSSLEFDAARGGAATPRGYVALSDVDGFTTPIDQQDVPTQRPTLTHFAIDLSGAQYQGLSEVTFRIYSYTPGGGRSVEYSNVILYGTVH
jgi:hypothetical protein